MYHDCCSLHIGYPRWVGKRERLFTVAMANVSRNLTLCETAADPSFFLHGSLGLAVVAVVLYSFMERRTHRARECCGGRPAIVVPINLLDDYEHRWAYACAFGAITNTIVTIFTGAGNYIEFPEAVWAQVLTGLALSIEVCVTFSPFFFCINTRHQRVGNLVGLVYAGFWLYVNIDILRVCANPLPETLPYIGVVIQIPTLFCLGGLTLRYLIRLIQALCGLGEEPPGEEDKPIAEDWQVNYVKDLFADSDTRHAETYGASLGCWQKFTFWVSTYVYDRRPSFRYSTRIICTICVVFCCTYQLGVIYFWLNQLFLSWFEDVAVLILNITDLPANSSTVNNVQAATTLVRTSWDVVTGITMILFIFNILIILGQYRKNSVQLYKGDRSFLPVDFPTSNESDNAEVVRSCMLFSGFQIAYMIWGFFIVNFVLWVLSLLIIFVIVLPLMNGLTAIVEWLAQILIIPFAVNFLLRMLQKVLANKLFLQDKINPEDSKKPLALDNPRFFHVVNYFFFLANIQTGLFSCLFRILKGLVFGLIFLGRLDRCVLMSGMETGDKGYMAYVGMLYIEETHSHPVLRIFCQIMKDITKGTSGEIAGGGSNDKPVLSVSTVPSPGEGSYDYTNDIDEGEKTHAKIEVKVGDPLSATDCEMGLTKKMIDNEAGYPSSGRARQRWFLAYTLIHNPRLITDRRSNRELAVLYQDNNQLARSTKTNNETVASKESIIQQTVVMTNVDRYHKLREQLELMEVLLYGTKVKASRRKSMSIQTCSQECVDGINTCTACVGSQADSQTDIDSDSCNVGDQTTTYSVQGSSIDDTNTNVTEADGMPTDVGNSGVEDTSTAPGKTAVRTSNSSLKDQSLPGMTEVHIEGTASPQ